MGLVRNMCFPNDFIKSSSVCLLTKLIQDFISKQTDGDSHVLVCLKQGHIQFAARGENTGKWLNNSSLLVLLHDNEGICKNEATVRRHLISACLELLSHFCTSNAITVTMRASYCILFSFDTIAYNTIHCILRQQPLLKEHNITLDFHGWDPEFNSLLYQMKLFCISFSCSFVPLQKSCMWSHLLTFDLPFGHSRHFLQTSSLSFHDLSRVIFFLFFRLL